MDTRDMTPEEVTIITQEVETTPTLIFPPTSTPTPILTPTPQVNPISEPAPPITGSGQPSWLLPAVLLSAAIVVIAISIRVRSAGKYWTPPFPFASPLQRRGQKFVRRDRRRSA